MKTVQCLHTRKINLWLMPNTNLTITKEHSNIWAMAWDFQQCGICDKQGLRSACAYTQSDQSLCLSLEYSISSKLLTEQYLEFLSLKGGCKGWSEPTLVKMQLCWKSHATAHLITWNNDLIVSKIDKCLRSFSRSFLCFLTGSLNLVTFVFQWRWNCC